MLNRIFAIAKKELKQLSRDTRMLFIIFFFPVVLLIIFGYAINFDVKHIKIAVYDQDKSDYTREYVNGLISSEYFDLVTYVQDNSEIKRLLDEKIVQAVVVFPIDLQPRFWYNPELKSTKFLIPGLMGMILIVTAVISISLSIVREKERGTIEQINVSPLSSLEFILGKTIPYIVISLINATIVLLAGYILFGIVIKGNILLLLLGTFAFLFAALSLGVFISTISDSQQVAFQAANVTSLLPSLILSGFIFPIESMPVAIQVLTNITPAKFYIVILRAILLRGAGISAFWDQLIYLGIFGLVFIALATLVDKKSKN